MGYRGSYLGILSFGFALYGLGLILGYKPTFLHALGVDVWVFGVAWIAVGCVVVTGVFAGDDRIQFAVAVAAMTGWALMLAIFWQAPFGWTAAVSWLTPDLATMLAASWPDPTPRPRPEP
jgi:hypothetical protein